MTALRTDPVTGSVTEAVTGPVTEMGTGRGTDWGTDCVTYAGARDRELEARGKSCSENRNRRQTRDSHLPETTTRDHRRKSFSK